MLTKEIRSKTFLTAKPVQQWLYSDGENGDLLFYIAQKYDLHEGDMYKKFAVTVGDIILGFYQTKDTVPLLQQELGIDPRTAALLGADVLDFLAPLSDPNWQPPVEEDNEETHNEEPTVNQAVQEPASTDLLPNQQPVANSIPVQAPHPTAITSPESQPTVAQDMPTHEPDNAQTVPPPPASPTYHYQPADTTSTNQPQYTTPPSPASPYDTDRPTPPAPPQSASPHFHYEPVHQSTQPNTRQPLSDIPTYQSPTPPEPVRPPVPVDTPRWETEK